MGFSSRGMTQAQVLSAVTTDDTKWAGANIDQALTTTESNVATDILNSLDVATKCIFSMNANNSVQAIAGTWTTATEINQYFGKNIYTSTNAQNDNVCIGGFYMPETDDVTVLIIADTGSDRGKAHFLFNNTDKTNIDCYTGSHLYNQALTGTISSLTAGYYNVQLKVSDKNGSSTNYHMKFSNIFIYRT